MDKEYMLLSLRRRRKVLEHRYKNACKNKDDEGNEITYSCACAVRTKTKFDLQMLNLIEQLLMTCSAVFIEDEDAIDGYHKLVEQNERIRSKRNEK